MKVKVSIVIPVYNVERYLEKCLDSVIAQSLKEIEIICINDGSTDGSQSILKAYEKEDCRIKVIYKKNEGLSAARNDGIACAQGEYILFLDSDDFLYSYKALEELYLVAKKDKLEQLFYKAEVFFENDVLKEKECHFVQYYKYKGIYNEIKTGKEIFVDLCKNKDFKPNVGLQLFEREFLNKNDLKFFNGVVHEDELFTVQCITLANRVCFYDNVFLGRRIRENSIMTGEKKAKSIYGYFKVAIELMRFAERNEISNESECFRQFFFQRIQIMVELAAEEYRQVPKVEKENLYKFLPSDEIIRFMSYIQMGERACSLKERLYKTYDEKRERGEIIAKCNQENSRLNQENSKLNQENKDLQLKYSQAVQREQKIRESKSYKIGRAVTAIPRAFK